MSEPAWSKKLDYLNGQLEREKQAHRQTRRDLQLELARVWRLVDASPYNYVPLMGVFPPLKKLLMALTELADLQDPSRGAPIEDTMRVEYVSAGENASTSSTERGVLSHMKARSDVRRANKELEYMAHRLAQVASVETEYEPPDGRCQVCWREIDQPSTGRPRKYCRRCAPPKYSGKHQRSESAVGS